MDHPNKFTRIGVFHDSWLERIAYNHPIGSATSIGNCTTVNIYIYKYMQVYVEREIDIYIYIIYI